MAVTRLYSGEWQAVNPEYKDYATGLLVPVDKNPGTKAGAKQFFHAPTEDDVNSALRQAGVE